MVAVLVIVGVVLVAAIGGGAIYLAGKGDKKHNSSASGNSSNTAVPQMHDSVPGSPGSSAPPVNAPSSSPVAPPGGAPTDLAGILTPTFKTGFGDTFTRLKTRDGQCDTYANPALKAILPAHPCTEAIASALYRDAAGTAEVTVTIMKFASPADADAVAAASGTKSAYPFLISNLRGSVNMWVSDKSQGSYVVYAHAIKPGGGPDGPRGGPIYNAAVHMGVELRNVLIWK